jgi:hypothetical protein
MKDKSRYLGSLPTFGIMVPMARCLPKVSLVHVGGDDFVVSAASVFLAQKVKHGVVDPGAVGKEEA